ncbi:MAG: ubiquinone/menaquinone biosynthesis methyltransferase [Acidilobaceae archaeon]|nr:ubiquinone/menaquinone biosynthesis methyltransferase [Acidilobaceae archaeon]MCX8165835.1 ubiquinone/menaquinone biosynthesis methyltransferase [Acidilobaceae archaeon]MDW7974259.1 ubiquinone/menaquinone biosynthesis methyltransferase [Sulfolobales archaeon]
MRGINDAYVRDAFRRISWRYDLMNIVMSWGMDQAWRRKMVSKCRMRRDSVALDVCTGTAMVAAELEKVVGKGGKVLGVDFSREMLSGAVTGGNGTVELVEGDALNLPFRDSSFDCVTAAYCIRNLKDKRQAAREIARVIKPGGRFVLLDMEMPRNPLIRELYKLYVGKIIPVLGWLIVGHMDVYQHLLKSLQLFPQREERRELMREVGLREVDYETLIFGGMAIQTFVAEG